MHVNQILENHKIVWNVNWEGMELFRLMWRNPISTPELFSLVFVKNNQKRLSLVLLC